MPPRRNRNHGALPAHLPRYEVSSTSSTMTCPCCGGALHAIGELRTEQLDIVPSQLRVRVTRRPRYACRDLRGCRRRRPGAGAADRRRHGHRGDDRARGGQQVLRSLPLYRQSQMLARQGITLDRSTLSNWVGRACWWLTPLYDLVVGTVLAAPRCLPTTRRCRCWTPAGAGPSWAAVVLRRR